MTSYNAILNNIQDSIAEAKRTIINVDDGPLSDALDPILEALEEIELLLEDAGETMDGLVD